MTAFLWVRVTNVREWQPRPSGHELDQGYTENKTRRAGNGKKVEAFLSQVHTDKFAKLLGRLKAMVSPSTRCGTGTALSVGAGTDP